LTTESNAGLLLAFETSCDETAVAILDWQRVSSKGGLDNEFPPIRLLSSVVASQTDLHAEYGGVVPELASREHLRLLPIILKRALDEAQVKLNEVTVIAVTQGPGLLGCLLTGISFAKGVALRQEVPLLGVNHLEGHLVAPYLSPGVVKPVFPHLALLVSGGHTALYRVEDFGEYHLLGQTIDDAAGEAFDKLANLLGLTYPGGAQLAKLADAVSDSENSARFSLPIPMQGKDGFSFSGLKTASAILIERLKNSDSEEKGEGERLTHATKCALAHAIQEAIVLSLVSKVSKAVQESGIRRVVVTGGVAANNRLRMALSSMVPGGVSVIVPEYRFCTDNAAMIGLAACLRLCRVSGGSVFVKGASVSHHHDLDYKIGAKSRWPLESVKHPIG
jgi:N6-L-threonylcarbamoyladenine synthase